MFARRTTSYPLSATYEVAKLTKRNLSFLLETPIKKVRIAFCRISMRQQFL